MQLHKEQKASLIKQLKQNWLQCSKPLHVRNMQGEMMLVRHLGQWVCKYSRGGKHQVMTSWFAARIAPGLCRDGCALIN